MSIKNRMFKYWCHRQVKLYVSLFLYSPNNKHLQELVKRSSEVQEKDISCERALNFDQWKTFSKNYKPMRVRLWLVYKFTKNNCGLQLFFEFIETQKSYRTSLDKISILTLKLLIISCQSLDCELNS